MVEERGVPANVLYRRGGRKTNTFGDPVRVTRSGDSLRVRYYPTGIRSSQDDRRYLPGKWAANDPEQVADAYAVASRLRVELLAYRAACGAPGVVVGDGHARIAESIDAYLADAQAVKSLSEASVSRQRSRLMVLLRRYGSCTVDELAAVAPAVMEYARSSLDNGRSPAAKTVENRVRALHNYGGWVARTYRVPNPFALMPLTAEQRAAHRRDLTIAALQSSGRPVMRFFHGTQHTLPFVDGVAASAGS
jgi:hypothetical protein